MLWKVQISLGFEHGNFKQEPTSVKLVICPLVKVKRKIRKLQMAAFYQSLPELGLIPVSRMKIERLSTSK